MKWNYLDTCASPQTNQSSLSFPSFAGGCDVYIVKSTFLYFECPKCIANDIFQVKMIKDSSLIHPQGSFQIRNVSYGLRVFLEPFWR